MKTEWKKVRLGDIATVTSSKRVFANQYTKTGIPFYRQKEIIEKNRGEELSEQLFISNDLYRKMKMNYGVPQKNDLLITGVGVTLGIPYLVKDETFYFKDGNLIWLKDISENVNSQFIFYYINSAEGQKTIWVRTIGSAQPALTIDLVKQFQFPCPPLETQQKIAEILSAYDDLIENNRKQIKLLEEAAQKLYKEWFVKLNFPGHENVKIVDGVPEGWTTKTIEELGEYLNGYAFKPSDWKTEGLPIIKIKEMNQGITKDTPRNSGEQIPKKYIIKTGDIVFSWSATLAVVIWTGETGLLNQHLFKVTPATSICREFVFQTIKYELDAFSNLTTGATMKHIQRNKLSQLSLAVPDKKIMSLYDKVANPIREKIINSKLSILNLQSARDELLPKLMNGEIEV